MFLTVIILVIFFCFGSFLSSSPGVVLCSFFLVYGCQVFVRDRWWSQCWLPKLHNAKQSLFSFGSWFSRSHLAMDPFSRKPYTNRCFREFRTPSNSAKLGGKCCFKIMAKVELISWPCFWGGVLLGQAFNSSNARFCKENKPLHKNTKA